MRFQKGITVMELCVFGDSIMKGVVWDSDERRYRMAKSSAVGLIEDRLALKTVNKSIFGCTILKGCEIISHYTAKNAAPDIAMVEYGGNDCNFNWAEVAETPEREHLPITPVKMFEELLTKTLNTVKERGIMPIVMNLPPIDAEKYFKKITESTLAEKAGNIIKWLGDVNMIYRYQEMYSDIIVRTAYKCGAALIDVRNAFLQRRDFQELLCDDGIHPNEKGQLLIGETVCGGLKLCGV